ncbi:unnamed protein product [Linum tenue]|uniref:Uncharacterized protein n=1 Tax=Linum tenue TaxID=586396 RepID=A0AAV0KNA6_9ROSI|nr:unnamed protein product [Linum tenue]
MGSRRIKSGLTAVVVLILLVLASQDSASARILCGSVSSSSAAAQEINGDAAMTLSPGTGEGEHVVLGTGRKEKYYYYESSLLLNVLPKGSRGPSGPSRRTNDLLH